jgi:hypothetical protein
MAALPAREHEKVRGIEALAPGFRLVVAVMGRRSSNRGLGLGYGT